jgi:hypothetical protein
LISPFVGEVTQESTFSHTGIALDENIFWSWLIGKGFKELVDFDFD